MATRALYKAVAPARSIVARQSNVINSILMLDVDSNLCLFFPL